jgi:PAS domain S-box-containing protein
MDESPQKYPVIAMNRDLIAQSENVDEHVDFDPRTLIPVPIIFCDADGWIVWLNVAAEELTGIPAHQLIGNSFAEIFPPENRRGIFRQVLRWRRKAETKLYLEAPLRTASGKSNWVGLQIKRVSAPSGKDVFICSCHDLQAMRDELESMRRQVSELEARIDEATATVRLKSEYVTTISEDIRGPMSGVVGMSRHLLETELDPEQRTYAEVIENSGQQLLDVVDDLLDFTRIEAGQLEIKSIDFDLQVVIEAVAMTLGARAAERGIEFTFAVDQAVQSELIGDPGRFRQLLLNLGDSMIEQAKGRTIGLQVDLIEEDARAMNLRVGLTLRGANGPTQTDTSVFEAFAKGDAKVLRGLGSRGLGLNLCRQLISLMRGETKDGNRVTDTPGYCFTVPFQKQAIPEPQEASAEVDLSEVRVLIGDPTPANSNWLAETIGGWGCTIWQAQTGEELIEELRSAAENNAPYHAALIDLDLPELSVAALSSSIRQNSTLPATVLMMITNFGRPGDAEWAEKLGFRAYLPKPIEPVDLREALLEILRFSQSEQERGGKTGPSLITRHYLAERRRREQLTESQPEPEVAVEAASVSTAEDAVTEAPEDTVVEMPVETVTEAPEDTVVELPVEAVTEAPEDTVVEMPVEAVTEAPEDTGVETPVEAVTETPVDFGTGSDEAPEPMASPDWAESDAPAEEPGDEEVKGHTDLSQVLRSQASMAIERLKLAIEIRNLREVEWEARSLEKICTALGAEDLARGCNLLTQTSLSGEPEQLDAEFSRIEQELRNFCAGDQQPPLAA